MDTLSTENLDIDNVNYSYDIEDVSDDLSVEDQKDLLAIENYESLLKFRDDLEEDYKNIVSNKLSREHSLFRFVEIMNKANDLVKTTTGKSLSDYSSVISTENYGSDLVSDLQVLKYTLYKVIPDAESKLISTISHEAKGDISFLEKINAGLSQHFKLTGSTLRQMKNEIDNLVGKARFEELELPEAIRVSKTASVYINKVPIDILNNFVKIFDYVINGMVDNSLSGLKYTKTMKGVDPVNVKNSLAYTLYAPKNDDDNLLKYKGLPNLNEAFEGFFFKNVTDDLKVTDIKRANNAKDVIKWMNQLRDDFEECELIFRKHLEKHSIPLDITALADKANGRVYTNLRAYGPNMIRLRWASNSVFNMIYRYVGVIRELKKYLKLKRD